MIKDYRRTIYEGDTPNYFERKKSFERQLFSEHPKVLNHYNVIRNNDGSYKRPFLKAYDNKCAYCGVSINILNIRSFQIDHITPKSISKNNINHISNLVPACEKCNNGKLNFEMNDQLNPDDRIVECFERADDYSIIITEQFADDKIVKEFYYKIRLNEQLKRLDYLLLNIHGMKDRHKKDRELYINLTIAIEILQKKRNVEYIMNEKEL